jgi:hypothetical protein
MKGLCRQIDLLSKSTYRYLSRVFKYELGIAEIGITDFLIFNIVDYCFKSSLSNVIIYKVNSYNESLHGNDIDLFIQRLDGKYNWFVLQAKVMSYNGNYKDLRKKKPKSQWDNLLDHEKNKKSKSFYLFYNGKSTKSTKRSILKSDCKGKYSVEDLGLGIVETSQVKIIKETRKRVENIHEVLLDNMYSMRKLFCCTETQYEGLKGYDFKEINTKAPYELIKLSENVDNTNNIITVNHNNLSNPIDNESAKFRILVNIIDNKM